MKYTPSVLILLASFNGVRFINEQIQSIINQKNVRLKILISDDCSDNKTILELKRISHSNANIEVIYNDSPSGSSASNFIRLITSARLESFDYIALCDQDDIWLPFKLERAISIITSKRCCGYSSSVEAFWETGRKKNPYSIITNYQGRFSF
jgi:rhamnosyltransferase